MTEEQEVLRSGKIRLDIASQRLECAGEVVELRLKHMQLLHVLMSRPGELVSKRELIDIGWGNAPVTDAVLTTAIKEIRRALGDDAKAPWAVENVHAHGYRFLPAVEVELRGKQASAPDARPATATPSGANSIAPSFVAAAALLVLALLPLLLLWPRDRSIAVDSPPTPEGTPPAIAVLPLDDMSPQGDQRWFADGLAEEILNELAQSPRLRVASRTSAFRFRESDQDIRDIAVALGVDYVMEGSVRTAGERLRITVQLIRAADGLHVLSRSWNRPFDIDQVFDVQHEISQQVLEVLSAAIGADGAGRSLQERGEIGLQAYEQFLRGRELVRTRARDKLIEGIELLERSIAAAPDYAASHAALALGRLLGVQQLGTSFEEARAQAAAHLRTAMALAPGSAEVLTAAALLAMMEGDPERSLALSDQALNKAPNTAEAQYRRAIALSMLGRSHDAYAAFQRAALLDPLSPVMASALGLAHLHNREEALALELAQKVLRWNPEHSAAQGALGLVLGETGQYVRAYELIDKAWQQNPGDPLADIRRNQLLWRLGADAWLTTTEAPHNWSVQAAINLEQGDVRAALELARANPNPSYTGITAFDIAYWAGEGDVSRSLARLSIQRLGLTESRMGTGYTNALHQCIVALAQEPEAADLRALMAARFDDWSPPADGLVRDEELMGAAAWRLLNDDAAGALDWLEEAVGRGRVLRELRFDPLFDSLRDEARFQRVLASMEEIAAEHRAEMGYQEPLQSLYSPNSNTQPVANSGVSTPATSPR